MEDVASKTNQWKEIAIALLFEYTEVERIEIENSGKIEKCFINFFSKWKKNSPNLQPYSWKSIVNALRSPAIKENALAQTISDKYLHQ